MRTLGLTDDPRSPPRLKILNLVTSAKSLWPSKGAFTGSGDQVVGICGATFLLPQMLSKNYLENVCGHFLFNLNLGLKYHIT